MYYLEAPARTREHIQPPIRRLDVVLHQLKVQHRLSRLLHQAAQYNRMLYL